MRMPKEGPGLARTIARYMTAEGVPVKWDAADWQFRGLSGVLMKKMNPSAGEGAWARMPEFFKRHEKDSDLPLVLIVASKRYGENVSDAFVIMRISTLVRWLGPLVKFDRERMVDPR
jgi:hypothetical protein